MTTTTTTSPAVRGTWKQHGNPTSGFEFFGTAVKAPAGVGLPVGKVVTNSQGITLKSANGRAIKGGAFGNATKFWAVVPAEAPRLVVEPKTPKTPAVKQAPVVITAAKGGDKTVTPIKGAIAKAIAATGKSIMAVSREHGLNPSQMRRLSLDTVAKVDLTRAEVIAKALGVKVADLFGEATDKAKAAPKNPAPATTGPKTGKGSKSKATKAAEKTAAEQAVRDAALESELGRVDDLNPDEAKAAQDAAEGTQETPATDETPAAE
jgi:lambda repressor-like predicted transcriptional regulator